MKRLAAIFAIAVFAVFAVSAANSSDRALSVVLPPGASLDAAYDAAAPGDVIDLSPGSYSGSITGTKALPGVTFQGGSGVTLNMSGGNAIRATNITFDGPMKANWIAGREADGITWLGTSHTWFGIQSAKNVSLIGGESYCPAAGGYCNYDPQIANQSGIGSTGSPQGILIDGVAFHDWRRPAGSDWHTECLQVGSGIDVEVRNSTFVRCATHDIFIRAWGGGFSLKNWYVHDNVFRDTDVGFFIAQFAGDLNPANCTNNRWVNNQNGQFSAGTQGVRVLDCQVNVSGNVPVGSSPPPPPPPPPPLPPPPTPYAPACAPTCDEQIADLEAKIAAAIAALGG